MDIAFHLLIQTIKPFTKRLTQKKAFYKKANPKKKPFKFKILN